MIRNKVVLVTGSSKGIGAACIKKLASQNYDVVINYNKSEKEAKELYRYIKDNYKVNCLLIKCDLTKEDEIKNMVNEIIDKLGKIDILVNNAAISIDTLYEDKTKDNFMKTLEVNLVGTFLVSKYVCDNMYHNKYGKVVNITSTNGIDKYYPMCLDYDASKAGLISLTHNLALEYAPYINVNAIAPGWVKTESEMKDLDLDYIKSEEEKIFLKRFAEPEEIASLVSFLVSDEASYINNEIIRIDGGTY